jgi:hypothetical protein
MTRIAARQKNFVLGSSQSIFNHRAGNIDAIALGINASSSLLKNIAAFGRLDFNAYLLQECQRGIIDTANVCSR